MIKFVDLHGVLVDFITPVENLFGVKLYTDPEYRGDWHHPSKVLPDFYQTINAQPASWWAEMPLLGNNHLLTPQVGDILFEDVAILSTLWGNAASYEGVSKLLKTHFPRIKVVFTKNKHLLAKGNYLIDDKDENVAKWRQYEGVGVVHPMLCNSKYVEVLG